MSELLDVKDRKILYELDLNARQSDSEIARKVRLTRDQVRYRINKLQEEGFINYFITLIDTSRIGFDWYRTFFKFQNFTTKKEEEIIAWLKPRCNWVTKVEGPWDLNAAIVCKNIYEYRDFINAFILKFSSNIERYESSIITRVWYHHRDFLYNKKRSEPKKIILGFNSRKEYKVEQIDDMDYDILKTILKNARMKTVDIARKIGTTEMVVRYRLKKMIEKKVILGFTPFLDMGKLGYDYFKVHVSLQNLTKQRKKKIFDYVAMHPNSIHTTELINGADLEIEFQVQSNKEFYEIITEIRRRFGEIVRDYEFMQYTKEYKFTYLPEQCREF